MAGSVKNLNVRVLSSFVAGCFFLTQLSLPASAAISASIEAPPGLSFPDELSAIQIPSNIGKVQELSESGDPLVVLVQDAHSIPDAQRNIRNLIDFFQESYGLDTVALEGVSAKLNPQIFKSFPDKKILKEVFGRYLKEGELTGTTMAAVFNEKEASYEGIEDWKLYEEGYGLYMESLKRRDRIEPLLEVQRKELAAQKEKIYSPLLRSVDTALEDFHLGHSNLLKLLQTLADVKAPEEGSEIALLLKEQERSAEVRMPAEREVKNIAGKIKNYFNTRPEGSKGGDAVEFNKKMQAFQTSQLTAEQFGAYLKDLCREKSLACAFSSELNARVKDQKRMQDIEGTRFFDQLEAYARDVKETLFRNDEERALDKDSHRIYLLERLCKLELTREQWHQVKSYAFRGEFLGPNNIQLSRENSVRLIPEAGLRDLFAAHLLFYANAEQRDGGFVKNILELFKKRSAAPGVRPAILLVAGGFHTEGLLERLKEARISVMLLMPEIKAMPEDIHYVQHMRGLVDWKDYFEAKDGKISIYNAFVRYTRDQLLAAAGDENSLNSPVRSGVLLKEWRDQIVRDLAAKGRLAQSGRYTRFMDEVSLPDQGRPQTENFSSKMDQFVSGLRDLHAKGELSQQAVARLLRPAAVTSEATYLALADLQSVREFSAAGSVSLPGLTENPSLSAQTLKETEAGDGPFGLPEAAPSRSELRNEIPQLDPGTGTQRIPSAEEITAALNRLSSSSPAFQEARVQVEAFLPGIYPNIRLQVLTSLEGEISKKPGVTAREILEMLAPFADTEQFNIRRIALPFFYNDVPGLPSGRIFFQRAGKKSPAVRYLPRSGLAVINLDRLPDSVYRHSGRRAERDLHRILRGAYAVSLRMDLDGKEGYYGARLSGIRMFQIPKVLYGLASRSSFFRKIAEEYHALKVDAFFRGTGKENFESTSWPREIRKAYFLYALASPFIFLAAVWKALFSNSYAVDRQTVITPRFNLSHKAAIVNRDRKMMNNGDAMALIGSDFSPGDQGAVIEIMKEFENKIKPLGEALLPGYKGSFLELSGRFPDTAFFSHRPAAEKALDLFKTYRSEEGPAAERLRYALTHFLIRYTAASGRRDLLITAIESAADTQASEAANVVNFFFDRGVDVKDKNDNYRYIDDLMTEVRQGNADAALARYSAAFLNRGLVSGYLETFLRFRSKFTGLEGGGASRLSVVPVFRDPETGEEIAVEEALKRDPYTQSAILSTGEFRRVAELSEAQRKAFYDESSLASLRTIPEDRMSFWALGENARAFFVLAYLKYNEAVNRSAEADRRADARNRRLKEEHKEHFAAGNLNQYKGAYIHGVKTPLSLRDQGINVNVPVLEAILLEGNLAGEFVGLDRKSDSYPLNVDLSQLGVKVTHDGRQQIPPPATFHDFTEHLDFSDSKGFGPVYLLYGQAQVDGSAGELPIFKPAEVPNTKGWAQRLTFGLLPRDRLTGIIADGLDPKSLRVLKEVVAESPFYIPVYNQKGEVVLEEKEYDTLRRRASGFPEPFPAGTKQRPLSPAVQKALEQNGTGLEAALAADSALFSKLYAFTQTTQESRGLLSDHIRKVLERVAALPEYVSLSKSRRAEILFAALFHDIGKLSPADLASVPELGMTREALQELGHNERSETVARRLLQVEKYAIKPESIRRILLSVRLHSLVTDKLFLGDKGLPHPVEVSKALVSQIPAGMEISEQLKLLEALNIVNKADASLVSASVLDPAADAGNVFAKTYEFAKQRVSETEISGETRSEMRAALENVTELVNDREHLDQNRSNILRRYLALSASPGGAENTRLSMALMGLLTALQGNDPDEVDGDLEILNVPLLEKLNLVILRGGTAVTSPLIVVSGEAYREMKRAISQLHLPASGKLRNILILEDSPVFLAGYTQWFPYGIHPEIARSPETAREALEKGSYDLVISDVDLMTGQDDASGISLYNDFRVKNTEVPVLFVTARSKDQMNGVQNWKNAAHLIKPLALEGRGFPVLNAVLFNLRSELRTEEKPSREAADVTALAVNAAAGYRRITAGDSDPELVNQVAAVVAEGAQINFSDFLDAFVASVRAAEGDQSESYIRDMLEVMSGIAASIRETYPDKRVTFALSPTGDRTPLDRSALASYNEAFTQAGSLIETLHIHGFVDAVMRETLLKAGVTSVQPVRSLAQIKNWGDLKLLPVLTGDEKRRDQVQRAMIQFGILHNSEAEDLNARSYEESFAIFMQFALGFVAAQELSKPENKALFDLMTDLSAFSGEHPGQSAEETLNAYAEARGMTREAVDKDVALLRAALIGPLGEMLAERGGGVILEGLELGSPNISIKNIQTFIKAYREVMKSA